MKAGQDITKASGFVKVCSWDDNGTKIYIIIVFYFSPAKDCVSIPGIDDISPEEMRHEALSAKTAGTSAQYQQNLQGLIQGYQNKRQALLNPSQDLKEVLRKIYNKEPLQNIPPNLFQIGQNQGKISTCKFT